MNYSSFMSKLGGVVLAAVTSVFIIASALLLLSSTAHAQNLYFDPNNTQTETAGGSGSFSGSSYYNGTSPQAYSDGSNTIFQGAAGMVTVDAPVNPNYLDIGVTSGIETFGGTTPSSAQPITLDVPNTYSFDPNFHYNPIDINSSTSPGTESVVFNSNINLNITNQYYNNLAVETYTSGNVEINGGITFTNATTDATDPSGNSVGEPNMAFVSNTAGATFTLNSPVTLVNLPNTQPVQNGNYPNLDVSASTGNTTTLTLNPGASFVNTRISAGPGATVIDKGATYSLAPDASTNGPILADGGTYLYDGANGMAPRVTVQAGNGVGIVGSDLASDVTFAGDPNTGVAVSAYGATPELTAAAGGRVNFTGDVQNGNNGLIIKIGAGIVNMANSGPRSNDQAGGWEIQNGTLLAGVSSYPAAITGSGLLIDNVTATSSTQTYATLGGIGNVAPLVTAAGANSTIAPGDPEVNSGIGKLTLLGGLTANNGATFQFQLNGVKTNAYDQLAFAGSSLSATNVTAPTLTFDLSNIGGALTDAGGSSSLVFNAAKAYTLFTGLGAGSTLGTDSFAFDAPAGYFVSNYQYNALNGTFAVDIREVPEPSTYALMGLGMLFLLVTVRYRKLRA